MDGKRPPLPLVLTANDLLSGHSVFHNGSRWVPRLADALVAADAMIADRLQAIGCAELTQGEIVDPYLVSVALDADGRALPKHYRERIRVSGPTIAFAGPAFAPGAS